MDGQITKALLGTIDLKTKLVVSIPTLTLFSLLVDVL